MGPACLSAIVVLGSLLLLLILVLAATALMWQLFARGSGWSALAERYPAATALAAPVIAGQTLQVGLVRYRRCVTVGIHQEGLYLAAQPGLPLLPRNPPLLIPWSEFHHPQETRLYWRRAEQLVVGDPRVASITFPFELYLRFERYLTQL
jgi:hypothetical protein